MRGSNGRQSWIPDPATVKVERCLDDSAQRLVMIKLRMALLRNVVHMENAGTKFKVVRFDGNNDDTESLTDVLNDLIWWGNALRVARANHSNH